MNLMKIFKRILGYKEPEITTEMFTAEFPVNGSETKCATIKEHLISNPACGVSEKASVTADATVEKPKKRKRGRPRKKKKEE